MDTGNFCDGPFWDSSLLNATVPDLAVCFQKTILTWLPCAYLWLVAPFYIYYIRQHSEGCNAVTTLHRVKTVCTTVLIAIPLVNFLQAIYNTASGMSIPPVEYTTPVVLGLTGVLSYSITQMELLEGVQCSAILSIFWILSGVCHLIRSMSQIRYALNESIRDPIEHGLTHLYTTLSVIMLVLTSTSENTSRSSKDKDLNTWPESSASFLSRLTFSWLTCLIKRGYKKPLEREDLWSLDSSNKASHLYSEFEKAWKTDKKRMPPSLDYNDNKLNGVKKAAPHVITTGGDNKEVGSSVNAGSTGHGVGTTKRTSLLYALAKTFRFTMFLHVVMLTLILTLEFTGPYLLGLMINFVSDENSYLWQGLLLAVVMFGNSVLRSVIDHQIHQVNTVVHLRVRSILNSAVYRKALVLTNDAKKKSTVGEIVNLMSVDSKRLSELPCYYYWLLFCPLFMIASLAFLWHTLEVSVLAGFGVMLLLIPVNAVIQRKGAALDKERVKDNDLRIKLMNEILNGIKILKLYSWENSFMDKVLGVRQNELDKVKIAARYNAIMHFIWECTPVLVSIATFAVYVNISPENTITAEKIFVSQNLFGVLSFSLQLMPPIINGCMEAALAIKRLQKFFDYEELDSSNVIRDNEPGKAITIDDATFSWGKDQKSTLSRIGLDVNEGELVAVVGQVGCGKSSLLSAMLGDMEKTEGIVKVKGSIAYVPQLAWVQNDSVRDNITFGKAYDKIVYNDVVNTCALRPDISMLPGGDLTEIGEKGVNLSVGQKQRVSLARAVYSDSDVYLLDDPLSAVDAHVGKHIFNNVIGPQGLLKDKTRILVTHGVSFLPQVDKIVVIVDGQVTETGSYKELQDQNGAFAEFLRNYSSDSDDDNDGDEDDVPTVMSIGGDLIPKEIGTDTLSVGDEVNRVLCRSLSGGDESNQISSVRECEDGNTRLTTSKLARQISLDQYLKDEARKQNQHSEEEFCKRQKLIDEEITTTGSVKFNVYVDYLKTLGVPLSILTIILIFGHRGVVIISSYWLSKWSEQPIVNGTQDASGHLYYLGMYGVMVVIQGLSTFFGLLIFRLAAVKAAEKLHFKLLSNILRCPMSFFDVTPTGRILNRFTKDIEVIDGRLPHIFRDQLSATIIAVSSLTAICFGTPLVILAIAPMAVLYYLQQRFYVATSTQLARMESASASPIFSFFSETIAGTTAIRAYGHEKRFIEQNEKNVDENQTACYPCYTAHKWLGLRLAFLGDCIVFAASLFAVLSKDSLHAGVVGLCITYARHIHGSLNWMVWILSDLETKIVSVERVKEYSEVKTEAAASVPDNIPQRDWPQRGKVEFINYSTKYREGLDLVIKGIDLTVEPGEKIGIVGRTGAGKSSLTLALFRLIEPVDGTILIDGVDITKIGLQDLRSRLTIIPQDPVLFAGKLRMNLDPFNNYTDDEIWRTLKLSHLSEFVSSLDDGLDYECQEGGENLSVGQRQLICLARALLHKSRILVLDEATAAVDLKTDELIQSTLRTQFSDCTVLTIAHRLNTIMDSTRVLVLDKGRIAEFDTPANLLSSQGIFHGMAQDAGIAE